MTLKCVAANAVWTNKSLSDAHFDTSPLCGMCGEETDTVHHRAWCCKSREAVELRQKLADKELIEKAARAG